MSVNESLGLVMLFLMVPVIFIGFPISFTLLFLALVFGYIGMGPTVFDLLFFQTIGLMKEGTLPGGTLGILIPPSVMLVVMGPVMGVSVYSYPCSSR